MWLLGGMERFVLKELYMFLKSSLVVGFKGIWKLRMPTKIKIFLWLMIKNSILTKDSLIRRGWTGNKE